MNGFHERPWQVPRNTVYPIPQMRATARVRLRDGGHWPDDIAALIKDGKIPEPRRIRNGRIDGRMWTARDAERVRKFKQENLPQRPTP